jgi:hypothetical protein
MSGYCDRRFHVSRRADKVCDTIQYWGSRRIPRAVLLDDLRCDGSGHDGCEAECVLFFKEAWLRLVSPSDPPPSPSSPESLEALRKVAGCATQKKESTAGAAAPSYRCQATDLLGASEQLRTWDPRPYVRECASGNVSLGRFVKVMSRAAVEEPLRKLHLLPAIWVHGTNASSPRDGSPLHLKPGDWVQVKSREEIEATLNDKGKNRGLWFDREMLRFCGQTYRVRRRITRLVDERNGQMIHISSDCVTLEGSVCSGEKSLGRWFCPRAIYHYWRECWLRRVDPPGQLATRTESRSST